MAAATSSGKCELCGKTFGKSAMTRHVKECGFSRFSPGRDESYHVIVDGASLLQITATATPFGVPAFRAKNTVASFQFICVQ